MNKSPLKIPKGLRRFTDADWQLFCGANKFHDGSRPIIGDCYLYVDDRAMWEQASTQEGILTISLDDAGKLTVQVAVGCFTLLHEVRSLHQAFQLATWIVARKRGQARFVSELKTRGFTLC